MSPFPLSDGRCGSEYDHRLFGPTSCSRPSAHTGRHSDGVVHWENVPELPPAEAFALYIEAVGLPRYVGPFPSREAATAWMDSKRPFSGSWHVIPLTTP